ncbi:MAG TPA: hypothetical protein VJH55_00885 [Candidatus Paceibacterota bacterium]
MQLICPECKNDVSLEQYPNLAKDQVVECDTCGISLLIKEISNEKIEAEIVDEGK